MTKLYLKPETIIIEVESHSLMAAVSGPPISTDPIVPGNSDAKPFDFTPIEEQEEPTRNTLVNEEEWDDLEEEEM